MISENGCTIPEFECFQRCLAIDNIAIVVFNFTGFRQAKPLLYVAACSFFFGRDARVKLLIM